MTARAARWRLAVWLAATALPVAAAAQAPAGDDRAAIARGAAALAWAQGFPCPVAGRELTAAGVSTADDARRVRAENWRYVETRKGAMTEVLRARQVIEREVAAADGRPSKSMQASFARLDDAIAANSARTANALAQWMLASWALMSRTDPDADIVGGADELRPFFGDGQALATLAQGFGGALAPLVAKYDRCLGEMQSAVIEHNAPQIRAAAERAGTVPAMTELIGRIGGGGIRVDPASAGGAILAELSSKRDGMVAEARRVADLRAAQASASARAALAADAATTRTVASRYVDAIMAGRIDAAATFLAENVTLASPRGGAQGRQAVIARMRDVDRSGKQATMAPPQVDGDYRVFSTVAGESGSGRMYFTVAGGRISSIRLVQN